MDGVVVIAAHRNRATRNMFADNIDDFVWVRAVTDEVAQEYIAVRAACACVCQTRLKGLQIAVYVTKKRNGHR